MTDKYRFIQNYACQYGLRWLLQRMNVYPNAYYNYLKTENLLTVLRKNDKDEDSDNIS